VLSSLERGALREGSRKFSLTLESTPEFILEIQTRPKGVVDGANCSNRKSCPRNGTKRGQHPVLRKGRPAAGARAQRGGFRLYTAADIEHLRFIRSAQELGFSLAEIRELLLIKDERTEACTHVRDLIQSRLGAIRGKIEDLRLLERHLKQALHKCDDALGDGDATAHEHCPVLEEIAGTKNGKGNR
jgi:DNA-binding transcriptional MerR regulator